MECARRFLHVCSGRTTACWTRPCFQMSHPASHGTVCRDCFRIGVQGGPVVLSTPMRYEFVLIMLGAPRPLLIAGCWHESIALPYSFCVYLWCLVPMLFRCQVCIYFVVGRNFRRISVHLQTRFDVCASSQMGFLDGHPRSIVLLTSKAPTIVIAALCGLPRCT